MPLIISFSVTFSFKLCPHKGLLLWIEMKSEYKNWHSLYLKGHTDVWYSLGFHTDILSPFFSLSKARLFLWTCFASLNLIHLTSEINKWKKKFWSFCLMLYLGSLLVFSDLFRCNFIISLLFLDCLNIPILLKFQLSFIPFSNPPSSWCEKQRAPHSVPAGTES